ncbi:uncharacterized protein LOC114320746 [Camellia sinensis]|uniref:uncharacterized protein LOC114320746 n=1 Tax=Camellia sinensis TaxID=4442 RepID=UPI00103611ED|nr:uncharacterized protein LOC114320746 [Camellia sinensis]
MQELHALCTVAFVVIEVVLKRSGEIVSRYFNDVLKAVLRLQANLLVTPNLITEASTNPRWNCFQVMDLSGEIVSRYFNDVLKAVLRLQANLLVTPNLITEASTNPRWNCFQNCLGALDGTYIKVCVPVVHQARYRTRKEEIATNVLGVCSRDMNFIYVLPGWEGSAADSRVLRDAINRPNGLRIPNSYYHLVDAGYTNGKGFLAPYRGQRYHLSFWREGATPNNYQEYFNMKHASARNIIEKCFGMLKMKWAILRSASYYPIKTQNRIITACCLLHNFIRREMVVDPLEDDPDLADALETQPPMGDDFIETGETSNEWTEWRDTFAMQLYNNWLANGGAG